MSLINDMLRDLDARRQPAPGGDAMALPGMVLTPRPALPWSRLLTGVGLAVALAAGALLAWQPGSRPLPDAAAIHPTPPAALPSQPLAQAPITAAHTPAAPMATAAADIHPAMVSASPVDTSRMAATAESTHPAAAEPVPVEAVPVMESAPPAEPRIQKTVRHLTATEQAELHYQQATAALQQQRGEEARQRLQQALTGAPDHVPARLALAGIWIQAQQTQRALELLADGFARQPRDLAQAQLYGHLLLQQGDYPRARDVLEAAAPQARQNADYQALLGTLYQRLELPAQAEQHYRLALGLKPQQAVWWMGLGIALEQQQRRDDARAAFAAALRHPLGPALQSYVEGRVAALGR